MTTAAPLARYGAIEGALASGFATAELHHLAGHDRERLQRSAPSLVGSHAAMKKYFSSNTQRGVSIYLFDVTRLMVDACMLIASATALRLSGCSGQPRVPGTRLADGLFQPLL